MVIENVILSAVFGVIGYLMIRFDYPRITLVVALVLAALAERNYHQSMLMADQSWSIFFSRIPSAVLVRLRARSRSRARSSRPIGASRPPPARHRASHEARSWELPSSTICPRS